MWIARLYLFALVGVLSVAGCGQNRSNSPTARPADTSTSASATASSSSASSATPADTTENADLRVLVLGNSIAAGLGVPSEASFPSRLQQTVDSLGWSVTIQN